MNNERFIELLNLYIDRELAGPEIQEIEQAIAASPERQRIYAQYCKIQRTCEELLAHDVAAAPKPKLDAIIAAAQQPEAEDEEAPVIAFPTVQAEAERPAARASGRSSWGWGALSGMAAAAAAFAVYTGTLQTARQDNPAIDTAPAMASTEAAPALRMGPDDSVAPAFAANDDATYRTVLVLNGNDADHAVRLNGSAQQDDPFAWMAQVQFEPIRPVKTDGLEFKTALPMEVRNLPAFSYPYPGLDDTPPLYESAAFQFQR